MSLNPSALRKSVTVDVGGRRMTFETGWLAKQAAGSVLVSYDNSAVLVTCQNAAPRPGTDFFPLTVEYREKTGAAGKIPGGFFKREGRPTTKEILTCRLIDRPLRPMFTEGYMEEVQIIGTVLSADQLHDPDVCGMNGASLAVILAGLPFHGPIATVRVGMIDGQLLLNPTYEERERSQLEMVLAGSLDAITMVESGANELSIDQIADALQFGHEAVKTICRAQLELKALINPEAIDWKAPEPHSPALLKECAPWLAEFRKAVTIKKKKERNATIKELKSKAATALLVEPTNPTEEQEEAFAARTRAVKEIIGGYAYQAIRDIIVEENVRIDGRKTNEIRPIVCEVQPFPRTHGSSIFTRGETQAFVNCTLGTAEDTQLIDGLTESREERFLLHYNFPPFCTGEAKMLRSAGRREIGHGALAERALRPMLPKEDDFPYTIRVTSEILESNGSSSMATVCGGTLCMLDAGVPLKRPVAGIAMGLIKEGKTVRILSDILGDEDHCGDMDFKVCGTSQGITALQMDIKIAGLEREIMRSALEQAFKGISHILGIMNQAIAAPRAEISPYAPRYEVCTVPVDKIGMVIGPGGKNIRGLQEETGSVISIEDDGVVKIFSENGDGALKAKERIVSMVRTIEVGEVFEGKITSIKDFGVFVELGGGGQEGMCHVSELSDKYIENIESVVKLGDVIKCKVIAVEPGSGKIKLSAKAVILEERGETYTPPPPRPPRERSGFGGRGGDRGGRGRR